MNGVSENKSPDKKNLAKVLKFTFVLEIAKKIKVSNKEIRIVLWDERLTTEQAFKSMKSTGMKIKNIKSKLNSVSAIIILESYLQNENTK